MALFALGSVTGIGVGKTIAEKWSLGSRPKAAASKFCDALGLDDDACNHSGRSSCSSSTGSMPSTSSRLSHSPRRCGMSMVADGGVVSPRFWSQLVVLCTFMATVPRRARRFPPRWRPAREKSLLARSGAGNDNAMKSFTSMFSGGPSELTREQLIERLRLASDARDELQDKIAKTTQESIERSARLKKALEESVAAERRTNAAEVKAEVKFKEAEGKLEELKQLKEEVEHIKAEAKASEVVAVKTWNTAVDEADQFRQELDKARSKARSRGLCYGIIAGLLVGILLGATGEANGIAIIGTILAGPRYLLSSVASTFMVMWSKLDFLSGNTTALFHHAAVCIKVKAVYLWECLQDIPYLILDFTDDAPYMISHWVKSVKVSFQQLHLPVSMRSGIEFIKAKLHLSSAPPPSRGWFS